MRAIIIDDEEHCREGLEILLAKYCPGVEVVAQCSGGRQGIRMIQEHQPDVVFLDIEMPGMNGFEMLEHCDGYDFVTIFTTAYNEYAIKAIRHRALDYLVKPIDKEELLQALERAKENIRSSEKARVKRLIEAMSGHRTSTRVALPSLDGLIIIDTTEILYCESENNYTRFHLLNEKTILVSKTLKKAAALLETWDQFFRIHHSYLVNINFVKQYLRGNGGEVVLSNGKMLAVSRLRRDEFLARLEKL